MGISIAYQGKLSSPDLITDLITDLKARAAAAGWICKTMDELVAEGRVEGPGLRGLSLYLHKECEPVRLHVDDEGTFVNHFYHDLLRNEGKARMMMEALAESMTLTRTIAGKGKKKKKKKAAGGMAPGLRVSVPDLGAKPSGNFLEQGLRYNWTKTQFAGPEVHVAVCALLRHVKERYAPDLQVTDDTRYFEDGDHAKLQGAFAHLDRVVDLTARAFESAAAGSPGPTTIEGLLDRVNDELAGADDKLH